MAPAGLCPSGRTARLPMASLAHKTPRAEGFLGRGEAKSEDFPVWMAALRLVAPLTLVTSLWVTWHSHTGAENRGMPRVGG